MNKNGRLRARRKVLEPENAEAKWNRRKDLILFAFAIAMTGTISTVCVLILMRSDLPLKITVPAAGLLFFTAKTLLGHLIKK